MKVNLLQYADDTIFVGEFNVDNVVVLKSIMRCFELVSDLKMNIHNSRFVTLGVYLSVFSLDGLGIILYSCFLIEV